MEKASIIRNSKLLVIPICAVVVVAMAPAQDLERTARLLEELTNAPGPPGFEGPVREIVVGEFEELGAAIEYDGRGSLIATGPGGGDGPRIMVTRLSGF